MKEKKDILDFKKIGKLVFEGNKRKLDIADIEELKRKLGEKQTSSELFILAIDSINTGSNVFLIEEKDNEDSFLTFEVLNKNVL